jgi:flavin reductase (DIM6/NTAB) family NADH-FMN oxidoreductase RutF
MPNFEVGHKQLIHVLARSQESMAMHFATVKENQFLNIPHKIAASGLTQIDGCAAYFECETISVHLGGDHNIIVAKVLHLKHSPDSQPLIFAHSQFVGIDSSILKTQQ